MFLTLLKKDFQRIRRNPWPWVMNLALPLVITALFGLAFGGKKSSGPSIARIKVALVDEDESFLGSMLKSGLSQGDAAKYLEPISSTREEAIALLREDKLSAALIIPKNFTREYLSGATNLALEIIKNPAQSYYPAIIEELGLVAVTGLNALSRNVQSEFPAIQAALTNEFDFEKIGSVFNRLGEKVKFARDYIYPPLVAYETQEKKSAAGVDGPNLSIFAFILPGMASAFLLFLADHAMRDVHREQRMRTLDRVRSMTATLGPFVTAKVAFAAITVGIGAAILFGTGSVVFGIDWGRPDLVVIACAGYSIFAAGFLALLVALVNTEKKAEAVNTIVLFAIAFAGGSYFPANQLPRFFQEYICPLLPNYWFTEALRGIASGSAAGTQAFSVVLQLGAAGAVFAVIATVVMQRRLAAGVNK